MPEVAGTPDPQAGPAAGATEGGAAAGAGTTGNAATGAAATAGTLSLTQAELDAIVLNRTEQARRKATEAADKAKQWDEYQASKLTAEQKAAADAVADEARRKALNAQTDAKLATAEIRLVATEKGVRKEALALVAQLLAGSTEIKVSDDGEVTGAEAAINKLLTEHKYLLADKTAGGKSGAEFSGAGTPSYAEKLAAATAKGRAGAQESIALKVAAAAGAGTAA